MQYGTIPGIDKPVSRLVMGTMIVNEDKLAASFALLDAVYERGCTAFDTARVYASHVPLGQWINDRGIRDKVVVEDKGAHHSAWRKRLTAFDIAHDIHDTLARMQIDYIDLWMLHRDDPDCPVGPIIEALNEHRSAGRIRAFGASNWMHDRVAEANEYAEKHGLVGFAASSPNFSLAEQVQSPWGPDCVTISGPKNAAAREWYATSRMPVLAWSSLARGFFSGRLSRANRDSIDDILDASAVTAYNAEQNFDRLDRADQLAQEKGLSVPQIALAYVMNQPLNVFALIGAASGEEFEANTEALGVKLTPEELAWLDLRRDRV